MGDAVQGNYTVTYEPGTLTITKGTAVVTAPKALELTYNGREQELVEAGETTLGTLVYSLTKEGEYSENIPVGTNVDSYTVWYKVEDGDNYDGVEPRSVIVNIQPCPVTVTADYKTKVYDNDASTDPELTCTVKGIVEGEALTGCTPRRVEGQNVGNYVITVEINGENPNYTVTVENGTFAITPKDIKVTADDKTKVYDNNAETDPELTATVTGAVEGEGISYTLSPGQDVGEYAITVTAGENPNYTVTVESGIFKITPKAVTVKAEDKTKGYDNDDTTDPELTATVTGAVEGEEISYTVSRETGQNVGEYAITVTAGENPNYTVTVENGTFAITPKDIKVTADDQTKVYDNNAETDPELTATVTGAVEGEGISYTLSPSTRSR